MAGLSMGGGQTLQITSKNLGLFAWIGSFSAPLRNFDVKTSMNGVLTDAPAFNKRVRLFWIGSGTGETAIHEAAIAAPHGARRCRHQARHVRFGGHVARVADLAPEPERFRAAALQVAGTRTLGGPLT